MAYNGWTNRETWMVNLHWGDYWLELGLCGDTVTAESARSDVEAFVDEALASMSEGQRLFIEDWIDLGAVNWNEIASHYESEEA